MNDVKHYVIGEQPFIQKKLCWGQVLQIIKEVENVDLPSDLSPRNLVNLFADKLPLLVAIALVPEGMKIQEKNLDELIEFFKWNLSPDQAMEIIEDFFDFNPIPLLLEKLGKGIEKMTQGVESFSEKAIGSNEVSPSSQAETSRKKKR